MKHKSLMEESGSAEEGPPSIQQRSEPSQARADASEGREASSERSHLERAARQKQTLQDEAAFFDAMRKRYDPIQMGNICMAPDGAWKKNKARR